MRNLGKRLDEILRGNPPCRCCRVIKAPPAGRCVNKWSRHNLWSWSFANKFPRRAADTPSASRSFAGMSHYILLGTLIIFIPPGPNDFGRVSPIWLRSGTVLLNSCQLRRDPNNIYSRQFTILPLISHARVRFTWVMAKGSGPEISQKKIQTMLRGTTLAFNCQQHSC